jgi:hypothetical protein
MPASNFFRAVALLIGCVGLAAAAAPAHADVVTFDWSLTSPSQANGGFTLTGSGTITATTGVNGDMVTAISGELNGSVGTPVTNLQITGLAPLGSSGMPDNLILPIGSSFGTGKKAFTSVSNLNTANPVNSTNGGLEFLTADGSVRILSEVAPNSSPTEATGNFYEEFGPAGFGVGVFTLTAVTAVPEPSTWAMLLLGFFGVGWAAYRRKRTGMAFAA